MIRLKLDDLMTKCKLTQQSLSEATGLTEATISRWRRNKVDSYDARVLETLLRYFQCNLSDLLEYVQEK